MEDEAAGRRHLLVFSINGEVRTLTAERGPLGWLILSEQLLPNNTNYELQGITRVFIVEGIVYVIADDLVEYID